MATPTRMDPRRPRLSKPAGRTGPAQRRDRLRVSRRGRPRMRRDGRVEDPLRGHARHLPDRARGWALSQALGALSYYALETNPVLVREAQRWMAEVLADQTPFR